MTLSKPIATFVSLQNSSLNLFIAYLFICF
jgi:hypothetical protein